MGVTMSGSRVQNTKRNIFFSYIDTFVTFIFSFLSRTIIVHVLGDEYLGLSSLFSSVFQVLNMAELGFSTAIVYNMYRPIAENNVDTVCALLNYYRKIYRGVAIIIITGGICIAPFLTYFIKGSYPQEINIYVLYFLYLINTSSGYIFFAYKTALLNALQRLDLSKIAYTITDLFQYVMQIVSLLLLKNYYMFVFWMIIGSISKNLLTAYIAAHRFPQYVCKGRISSETKKDIISRVKGLLICNISSITYTTFDSIILSSFIGLTSVAIYSNYNTIFTGVSMFIILIRNAMQASVGNSIAIETREKNYEDVFLWQFLFSSIATWCVTCMISLYQPFMEMWMGKELLLPFMDVVLICIWFFITVIQNAYFLYLGGNGFWWEMRWPYILSTITNVIMNIVLGKLLGITGIIFSTLFSTFVFGLLWQCSIIFRYYFKTNMKVYQKKQFAYFVVCAFSCAIAFFINQYVITIDGILGFCVKGTICTAVSCVLEWMLYHKLDEFQRAKELLRVLIKR